MSEPYLLQVVQALQAHLEFINPDNTDPATGEPYAADFDLKGKVFCGKTELGLETVWPALALLEAPTPVEALFVGDDTVKSEKWRLLLQGFAVNDMRNPTWPAYRLKARVEQRLARLVKLNGRGDPLFPDEYRLGKLVNGLKVNQGVVRPPEGKISNTAFFYIPLTLEVASDIANPFAVPGAG